MTVPVRPEHAPAPVRTLTDRDRMIELVARWRANADMLADGNKNEIPDPSVGMQRACAAQLEAILGETAPATCAWPRCRQPALCASGNFGGELVCSDHFRITNGPVVAKARPIAAVETLARETAQTLWDLAEAGEVSDVADYEPAILAALRAVAEARR